MYYGFTGGGCTNMIALSETTADGRIIFGKNSDRPLNEAQPLCYYPARDYSTGAEVECTYIKIPQVSHTYACIGSRPYSIFGFEMGVNECGVAIGNEAVYGREKPERCWGLLGMDILRLALERSESAAKAVEIMGALLETYGTGGNPKVRDERFNGNYIITDMKEAYYFESMQRNWVAKRIESKGGIVNCYSVGEDYEKIGKQTLQNAIDKKWILPEGRLNAANVFTRSDCVFADVKSFLRYPRVRYLMESKSDFTVKMMMENLRDHYEGTPQGELHFTKAAAKVPCVCSHAGGENGSNSAASAVISLNPKAHELLRITYWNSMSPPCCSVFRPFYFTGGLPEGLSGAHALYNGKEHWWVFTELERYIALNYEMFAPRVKEKMQALEREFLSEAEELEVKFDGDSQQLKAFSETAAQRSFEAAKECLDGIKKSIQTKDINRLMLDYFKIAAEGCNMPYDDTIIK